MKYHILLCNVRYKIRIFLHDYKNTNVREFFSGILLLFTIQSLTWSFYYVVWKLWMIFFVTDIT